MLKRKWDYYDTAESKVLSNDRNGTNLPPKASLYEKDVFITEYISNSPGFPGIIKQRFSDFQVNEIDAEKNIIRLTNTDIPEFSSFRKKPNIETADCHHITKEHWIQLSLITAENNTKDTVKIEVTNIDKDGRTQIHQIIRHHFNGKLVTSTIQESDRKFIVIGMDRRIDGRKTWPDDVPEFLHFVLYKENMDTANVVNILASKLKVRPNMIAHAGTKDRRGKTTQRFCIRRVKTDQFKGLFIKNIHTGNYSYKDVVLKLGDLYGNRFRIALRNVVNVKEPDVRDLMQSVENRGFINYYGLQRFGTSVEVPTYEIGRCLVCRRWRQAIELILKPRSNDRPDLAHARQVWYRSRNSKEALKLLRWNHESIEAKVLSSLSTNGENAYVNALQVIPRNMAMLYVHSYQSLIWNRIISRRIKEFGFVPLAGDLVTTDDSAPVDAAVFDDEESVENVKFDDLQNLSTTVRCVTKDELHNIKINDIVYPLPGYKVQYPDNIIAQWYKDILAEDNMTSEDLKQNEWLFSAPGSYRKMIIVPEDFTWKLIKYNNPSADLIQSDLDILLNKPLLPENSADAEYTGLIIEFSLPSCVYATMAIREITKQDTSASYQSSLTTDHIASGKSSNSDI